MENESARRGKTFLKIIGILLAIGAVCFVVAKLYKKYFKKDEALLETEADDLDAIADESAAAEEAVAEEESFEAPAEAVIANADQMEA